MNRKLTWLLIGALWLALFAVAGQAEEVARCPECDATSEGLVWQEVVIDYQRMHAKVCVHGGYVNDPYAPSHVPEFGKTYYTLGEAGHAAKCVQCTVLDTPVPHGENTEYLDAMYWGGEQENQHVLLCETCPNIHPSALEAHMPGENKVDNGEGVHMTQCAVCGGNIGGTEENCIPGDEKMTQGGKGFHYTLCAACGSDIPSTLEACTPDTAPVSTGEDTHGYGCVECGWLISTSTEACTPGARAWPNGDGTHGFECGVCGGLIRAGVEMCAPGEGGYIYYDEDYHAIACGVCGGGLEGEKQPHVEAWLADSGEEGHRSVCEICGNSVFGDVVPHDSESYIYLNAAWCIHACECGLWFGEGFEPHVLEGDAVDQQDGMGHAVRCTRCGGEAYEFHYTQGPWSDQPACDVCGAAMQQDADYHTLLCGLCGQRTTDGQCLSCGFTYVALAGATFAPDRMAEGVFPDGTVLVMDELLIEQDGGLLKYYCVTPRWQGKAVQPQGEMVICIPLTAEEKALLEGRELTLVCIENYMQVPNAGTCQVEEDALVITTAQTGLLFVADAQAMQ